MISVQLQLEAFDGFDRVVIQVEEPGCSWMLKGITNLKEIGYQKHCTNIILRVLLML